MDFLKSMLAKDGAPGAKDVFGKVFDAAVEDAHAVAKEMMIRSKKFTEDGSHRHGFSACMYLFIFVHCLMLTVWVGVEGTVKLRGPRNEVSKLWHLIRTAFSTADEKIVMPRLNGFDAKWEGGEYDEWK